MESQFNDAALEMLLSKANVEKPLFLCPQGHQIILVCLSSECKHSAFICTTCDGKIHNKCLKQTLDTLFFNLVDNVQNHKSIFKEIYQAGNSVIALIKKMQVDLAEKSSFIGYEENVQKMIEDIFMKGKMGDYKGEDLKNLRQKLLEKVQGHEWIQKEMMAKIASTYDKLKQIIEKDFESIFLMENVGSKQNSSIIKSESEFSFIKQALESQAKVKSLKLLYRASENGFSASEFHKKCDNIEHTFTIVRTEFGRTIAGYTPLKWNQKAGDYAADYSKKSFLLQVDLKQKMTLTQPQFAIVCSPYYGPAFGACDFCINDKGDVNTNSSNFPSSYNYAPKPYENGQTSQQAFSGAKSGMNFKVLEYEVFKVQYL